jgi:hypothetical protein
MRWIGVTAVVAAALIAAFAFGRASAAETRDENASGNRELSGDVGDTVRIPTIGLYCSVEIEAFEPRFLCGRLDAREGYQVSFEKERTVVVKLGDPGDAVVYRDGS